MLCVIRTDASSTIGSGHVMRCATLADVMMQAGAQVVFITKALPNNLIDWLQSKGFDVRIIEPSAPYTEDAALTIQFLKQYNRPVRWLILDHYSLDYEWEHHVKPYCEQLMVIDDAPRRHHCDVYLDQNIQTNQTESRYSSVLPPACRPLLGPKFALLRPDFIEQRKQTSRQRSKVRTLLVSYGGSDPTGETIKAMQAIQAADSSIQYVNIIAGRLNSKAREIKALCATDPRFQFFYHTDQMAQFMKEADLFIGAAGTTTCERYCLGLPGILTAVADNQVETAKFSHSLGIDYYLGPAASVSKHHLKTALTHYMKNPSRLQHAAMQAMQRVDGKGVQRVVNVLFDQRN